MLAVLIKLCPQEKHSEEAYNLACILTLPCHQRKGYGRFLISLCMCACCAAVSGDSVLVISVDDAPRSDGWCKLMFIDVTAACLM